MPQGPIAPRHLPAERAGPPTGGRSPRHRARSARPPVHNRVSVALSHGTRFAFAGQARLAAACGVSRSTINRTVTGKTRPSLSLAQKIAAAVSADLGLTVCTRELFSPDGSYPTPSGCALCGCAGCLPEEAYDARGGLRDAYRDANPGDWSLAPSLPAGAGRPGATQRSSNPINPTT